MVVQRECGIIDDMTPEELLAGARRSIADALKRWLLPGKPH